MASRATPGQRSPSAPNGTPYPPYKNTGTTQPKFDGRLDYTTTRGVDQSLPFALTLAHVFNHGTHHRAQITAAITAMGHACPELDLVWMLQAENAQP